jgi:hypothetical protein
MGVEVERDAAVTEVRGGLLRAIGDAGEVWWALRAI